MGNDNTCYNDSKITTRDEAIKIVDVISFRESGVLVICSPAADENETWAADSSGVR